MVDMSPDANADAAAMAQYAIALADGIEAALPGWVERSVERLLRAHEGEDPRVLEAATAAGERAQHVIGAQVRALLMADVDDQSTSPLEVARGAVPFATEVLREAGVPPVVRDTFAERRFPDDDYDLAPATFADLDPRLHEVGLAWGAAKAYVILARRRAEGLR